MSEVVQVKEEKKFLDEKLTSIKPLVATQPKDMVAEITKDATEVLNNKDLGIKPSVSVVKDKERATVERKDSRQMEKIMETDHMPDSYTHLTLPTNREV